MRYTFVFLATLATTTLAQDTDTYDGPTQYASDVSKWSSVHSSLATETDPGRFSSAVSSLRSDGATITIAPPNPTWGPGSGPYDPNDHDDDKDDNDNHRWGGPDGWGPWGPSNWGPVASAWSSHTEWRTGPWTSWWGREACPDSDWPGWTEGPWSTSAVWTAWGGCTISTTATSVVTTTVSGSAVTSTAFGIQVAQVADGTVVNPSSTTSNSGGSGQTQQTSSSSSGNAAAPMKTMGAGAALGVAIFGLAVGL